MSIIRPVGGESYAPGPDYSPSPSLRLCPVPNDIPMAPLGDVTQPVERKLIRRYDDLVTNFGFLRGRTGG